MAFHGHGFHYPELPGIGQQKWRAKEEVAFDFCPSFAVVENSLWSWKKLDRRFSKDKRFHLQLMFPARLKISKLKQLALQMGQRLKASLTMPP